MSRPFSWYPLAGADPVPGDPAVVRAAGDRYVDVAATIGETARTLQALTDAEGTVSQAVAAVREKAETVAGDIARAQGRYETVGTALRTYAVALDAAQAEADAALLDARAAQQRLDAAELPLGALRYQVTVALTDEESRHTTAALARSLAERDAADRALAAARERLDQAVDHRDRAAASAVAAIEQATHADGLQDGWWEDWGADVAQQVSTWAGRISTWAGIASLFLGWVPVIGPILVGLSVAAGAVALVADLALALQRGDDGDWLNVALGVLGLLTGGASRALDGAVDAFRVSARAAKAQAATRSSPRLVVKAAQWIAERFPVKVVDDVPPVSPLPAGASYGEKFSAAWARVTAAEGHHRLLELAGQGDVFVESAALRSAFWGWIPDNPRAATALVLPRLQGAALKGAVTVTHAAGAALHFTAVTKDAVLTFVDPQAPGAPRATADGGASGADVAAAPTGAAR